ncbi:PKD domain-containing protein [Methanospirillum hungatei]|uniref:PKD domain-containing protein n=1 Tax=Methanospirillum hungatei TaxID=2203 RepID=UPI0026EE88F5|nr:PKD domain-containing protein [Methanospirillum hungatei]MCA1917465.1 PKD domain-containing protein [Methanospirillum hungatei]
MKNPLSWKPDVEPYFQKTFEFVTPEEGWIWYELESEVPSGATKPIEISSIVYKDDKGAFVDGTFSGRITKNIMGKTSLSSDKPITEAKVMYQKTRVYPGTFVGPAEWRITVKSPSNWGCGMPYSLTAVIPGEGKLTVKFVPKSSYLTDTITPTSTPTPDVTITQTPTTTPCLCTACFSAIATSSRGSMASGEVPLTIEFTDCSYPRPVSWMWDFQDGSYSTEQSTVHTFTIPGKYEPTLSVTCEGGCTDTISQSIEGFTPSDTSCPVSFTFTVNPNNPKEVTLKPIIPCEGAQGVRWRFGDGFGTEYLSTVSTNSHDPYTREYAEYGTYTVTLEVIFSTETKSSTQTILISPTPGTGILPAASISGLPPLTFTTVSKISDSIETYSVDPSGNIITIDPTQGTVIRIKPDGTKDILASGINKPRFPTLDQDGNIYVGTFDGTILKITPDGSITTFASNIWSPQGMGFDAQGNLYVASGYDGNIYTIGSKGIISTINSGFSHPLHLAVDPEGDIYIAESRGSVITRLTPDGGYGIFADIGRPIKGMAKTGDILYVTYDDTIASIDKFGSITPRMSGLSDPSWISIRDNMVYVTLADGTAVLQ